MKIFNWTYALRLSLLNDRVQASWNEELIVYILIYKKEEKENIRHGMNLLRFKYSRNTPPAIRTYLIFSKQFHKLRTICLKLCDSVVVILIQTVRKERKKKNSFLKISIQDHFYLSFRKQCCIILFVWLII